MEDPALYAVRSFSGGTVGHRLILRSAAIAKGGRIASPGSIDEDKPRNAEWSCQLCGSFARRAEHRIYGPGRRVVQSLASASRHEQPAPTHPSSETLLQRPLVFARR